ncbi:hypothetical protein ACIRVF_15740 [Kitasatospora sp. NPDC101157]|uniref:hypothetical protein n=1 Tax=Kitasatospora sp. NPDC101157 TaxID=3364098 RepID=UPI0037F42B1C
MTKYIIRGTFDRVAACDECQTQVERPVVLETVGWDGKPLGHRSLVGLDCAATLTRKDRGVVEREAGWADDKRREEERRTAAREAERQRREPLERQWLLERYGVDDVFEAAEKSGIEVSVLWEEQDAWVDSQL